MCIKSSLKARGRMGGEWCTETRRTGGQADRRTGGQADGRTGGRADGRTGGQGVFMEFSAP
ncbi:MAG: hypothetical protein NT040_02505 [Bacteroidetes bacterium]|nr:hypothetical protein [Bacteroidota bacterium]